jgi:hypothetical protein
VPGEDAGTVLRQAISRSQGPAAGRDWRKSVDVGHDRQLSALRLCGATRARLTAVAIGQPVTTAKRAADVEISGAASSQHAGYGAASPGTAVTWARSRTAGISFDSASTATWPRTAPMPCATAATRCGAFLSLFLAPRTLPGRGQGPGWPARRAGIGGPPADRGERPGSRGHRRDPDGQQPGQRMTAPRRWRGSGTRARRSSRYRLRAAAVMEEGGIGGRRLSRQTTVSVRTSIVSPGPRPPPTGRQTVSHGHTPGHTINSRLSRVPGLTTRPPCPL